MLESTVNTNRYIPSCMNAHIDYMINTEDFVFANCEVFYTTTNQNSGKKFYAMGFIGKSKNHAWYYQFATEERMRLKINEFIEVCKNRVTSKKEAKAKQKEMNANVTVSVGDVFVNSWGYDQTNVDYYQVVEVKGKTATLRPIASSMVEGSEGFMCCDVVPVRNKFVGESFKKRIQGYNGIPSFSFSYGGCSKVEIGQKHYCSWYA